MDDRRFQDQHAKANRHRAAQDTRQARLCRGQRFGGAGPGRHLSREEIRRFERELREQAKTDRRRTTP